MMKHIFQNKKIFFAFISILLLVTLGVGGVFGYEKYQIYQAEKQVSVIHDIIDGSNYSYENCEAILGFNTEKIDTSKINFRLGEYNNFSTQCRNTFDVALQEKTLDFCKPIIKGRKSSFTQKYILLDTYEQVQKECILEYLTATFSTGSLFAVENNFKSSVQIKFGLPFYEDVDDINSEAFIENRTEAKQRLISLLDISPSVEFGVDDIVLHPNSGTIFLDLKPETQYTFSLKSFDSLVEGEKIESKNFTLTTPKNNYFGIRKLDKVSLAMDNRPVDFELISYDTTKLGAKIKICRISNKDYAKIEVFENTKGLKEEKKKFFLSGIDEIAAYKCDEKQVNFTQGDEGILKKMTFNFSDLIGNPARSGLYYVTFSDSAEREYNQKVQDPIFFGITDSHITMKISRNGEAFFFINDFEGRPLAGQELRAYANNFISHEKKWNEETKKYDISYFSPLEKSVFDTPVVLGKTNEQGILEVNMKDKIDSVFNKTFETGSYYWDGNYDSFFVTSASDTNLSYVSSKWNGGISGWNFGYTQGWGSWWYGRSNNIDSIYLDQWGDKEPELYSHTYPDRKLYLPGEQVHLKSILRNSVDLSIPNKKELTFKIKDPKGKDLTESTHLVNEYGSITKTLKLSDDAMLGNYQVFLYDEENKVGQSGFSVEVFKNPKFKNEVMLSSSGLNDELVTDINIINDKTSWGYSRKKYTGNFEILASVSSKYYSGSPVKKGEFTYKVYKQDYYDNSYWDDCYYGCYWKSKKEFYTEGKGTLDENGKTNLKIPVEFSSSYDDYKYIVEVTVVDSAGDKISGANSLIARLPNEFKGWNPNNGIEFSAESRFYKSGESVEITGGLTHGSFSSEYNDKFILIIKKKEYATTYVKDVRGQERPITRTNEKLEKILFVNDENFKIKNGRLSLDYIFQDTGEYIFEFGDIDKAFLNTPIKTGNRKEMFVNIITEMNEKKISKVDIGKQEISGGGTYMNLFGDSDHYSIAQYLDKTCIGDAVICDYDNLEKSLKCLEDRIAIFSGEANIIECRDKGLREGFVMHQEISLDDLISNSKKYFTLISYGDKEATNPVESDNKITVLSEKVSYKLGETAKFLVRLPFSDGKILWTVEKQGVIKHEYIDVPGNTFFKEVKIDDSFMPNAYIGVVVVDTNKDEIPQYKVGYTEIVVDKTDKKSQITISPDKKTYEPRDTVTLDINASRASELTVMVVDDSQISLMGNIDGNALEKFYKKLPFQIQTSITNISMLGNYYFSRQGIVGGSGFGNFKGGDSAVSSRNIFKNTAYYNPSVITDADGNATVSFNLPDNLTNFRVMVLGQSKDNFFGYSEDFIEVRKDVIVEDRTPLILREGDEIELGANIFNTTDAEIGFKVSIGADGIEIPNPERVSMIGAGKSEFISWKVKNTKSCGYLDTKCEIPYTISVLGDSAKHSDKIEGKILLKHIPSLLTHSQKTAILEAGENADLSLVLPENTDIEKSSYMFSLSNNPLQGIEDIVKSLAVYPYGCGEQLLSSTMPNAVVKSFTNILGDVDVSQETIDKNLSAGLKKIYDMSLENGAFKYWHHDTQGDVYITSYGVRVLGEIQDSGTPIRDEIREKAAKFLIENYPKTEGIEKVESLWAIASYHKNNTSQALGIDNLSDGYNPNTMARHELIAYTYALVLTDSVKYKSNIDKNIIRIRKLLKDSSPGSYYYSHLSDKAEFTQMLIDYASDEKLINLFIRELYDQDWESYWYSTKTKNNAFLAFAKYMQTYGKNTINTIDISLNDETSQIELGSKTNNHIVNIGLSQVLKDNKVSLQTTNTSGSPLFASANIQSYPQDALKVTPFSNGVKLTRTIYEVVDSSDISESCSWNHGNRICTEAPGLKPHSGNTFKKGATYKIILSATFEKSRGRQNLTMEDYVPSGFSVLNSSFKTNEIATNQETTQNSWRWSHVEKRPDVVMAHAKSVYGSTARYQYFVRADFAGNFVYPPAVVYLMYQPDIKANTAFRRIIIN